MKVPYTYEDIKKDILAEFEKRGYLVEEGSNTAMFANIMSYLAFTTNLNNSFSKQESLISTATQKNNIISIAKSMGYIPYSASSYRYKLKLALGSVTNFGDTYTIDDKTFVYMGERTQNLEIEVEEGTLTQDIIITKDDLQYFDIFEKNLSENSFIVYVDGDKWTKSSSLLLENDPNVKEFVIYRYPDEELETTRIYFYINLSGNKIPAGSVIQYYGLITSGSKGEIKADLLLKPQDIQGPNTVEKIELLSVGYDEETLESIKTHVPTIYNTGNRLVTKLDYEAFINKRPEALISFVWGGDEEVVGSTPITGAPIFDNGNVYMSILPKTAPLFKYNNFTLADYDKPETFTFEFDNSEIKSQIDRLKIITLKNTHLNFNFIDVSIKVKILNYGIGVTEADFNKQVFEVITNYFKTKVSNKPENKLYFADLVSEVNNFVKNYNTSLTLDFETEMVFNKQHINPTTNKVKFYLAPSISSGEMPNIETDNFADTGHRLEVQDDVSSKYVLNKKLLLNGQTIGKGVFEVFGNRTWIFEIECTPDGIIGGIADLKEINKCKINVDYPDDDGNSFFVSKNTLIRLKEVEFVK